MNSNKTILAIAAACFVLILLIGWTFYQTLQLQSGPAQESAPPQKAVMAQAQALNESRLNELAQSGKVVAGMSEQQVRNALGEPERIEKIDEANEHLVVWWYDLDGWTSVVFDSKGLVVRIEEQ
ncbi:MAG: hypothetical protein ACE5G1_08960 [bacterium]